MPRAIAKVLATCTSLDCTWQVVVNRGSQAVAATQTPIQFRKTSTTPISVLRADQSRRVSRRLVRTHIARFC